MSTLSVSRLTIFAIVSALENDGRDVLRTDPGTGALTTAVDDDVRQRAYERARKDGSVTDAVDVDELVDYLDFGDLPKIIRRSNPGTSLSRGVEEFCKILDELAPVRNRVMHSRPLAVDDLTTVTEALDAALRLPDLTLIHTADVNRRLREEPAFVLSLQIPTEDVDRVLHNLPVPDYDDTSLVGRDADVQHLISLMKSNRPVISVIGEGGVGKSAVVLESLYRLIDDPTNPFDAVVWVSLKQHAFGPAGVRELNNAISSTVALIGRLQSELGGSGSNPLEDVIAFMNSFPALIVLDNLETINAGEIRDLLRAVPQQSKILITSRIGVGEFEERRPLEPLSDNSSVLLLRRCARILNVRHLAEADNERLLSFARKLYNNPLAIRWFVGAVANGQSAALAVKNKKDLLHYCFGNIYEHLPEDARTLLNVLLVARRSLSAAQIAFLLEEQPIDYRSALNNLLATSIVRVDTDRALGRTIYSLTSFASDFLRKFHSLDTNLYRQLEKRQAYLATVEQQGLEHQAVTKRDPRALSPDPNNPDEVICAAYLRQALNYSHSRIGDFDKAHALIEKARNICPDYPDVYRISGFVYFHQREYFKADEAYLYALELDPDSSTLHAVYAGFLLNASMKLQVALEHAEIAVKADECPDTLLTRGRARQFAGRYVDAVADFDKVLGQGLALSEKHYRIASDLAAETHRRMAEQHLRHKDETGIALLMKGLTYIFFAQDVGRLDESLSRRAVRICYEVGRSYDTVSSRAMAVKFWDSIYDHASILEPHHREQLRPLFEELARSYDSEFHEVAKKLRSLVPDHGPAPSSITTPDATPAMIRGVIQRIASGPSGVGQGFIIGADGGRYHFKSEVVVDNEFAKLERGSAVYFRRGMSPRGRIATEVRCVR